MTIIEDLKKLVEFESPSEDLAACRGVVELAIQIADENLEPAARLVEENNRPVFWWGSKSPEIVLLGHLDTVWPKGSYLPTWSVSGDIAKGPGIFDMKAGFLQAIYAVKEIPNAASKVAIIATTDEELGSQSSKALIERVSKSARAVLVLEASLNGKVKTGRKGTSMYQIALHGRASHAGLEPEKGINATTEIAAIVIEVAKLANPEFGTTVVPTVMHSGTTTNTVPALATLDVDIRSFASEELIRIDSAMKKLSAAHPEVKLEVIGGINRPPLETSSTAELYKILEKVASEIGMEPIGQASVGGASDGNFAAVAGARVLDGLGAVGDGAHAPHEQILLSSIPSRVKLLTAFIKELIRD
ncbi:MAG: M20/M25/M40 family metallo-hydrolase [Actinobacteria bacterium]|nr:M20/M25/M40 family metallo-hydrolase [Actinomycetota bacterium]MDA2981536.1 M20/M25/M40 family metallo-hydrolase [Actinomycetota bacterium]MDA2995921.1 M20/M25/M40 family metallo-hydrolase [Actinomycetota bacterium]